MPASFFYLHGFASSPGGAKIVALRERLAAHGHTLHAPDLNAPSFEQMTLTAMIAMIAREVAAAPPGPVYLIGSSLGGFAALHFLDRYQGRAGERVAKLMLLAPALDFPRRFEAAFSADGLAHWHADGSFPIMHYAHQAELPLHYGFLQDAQAYSPGCDLALALPILILHGQHDEAVPVALSEQFAAGRENITLHVLDTDHGMLDKVDEIWEALVAFFAL
ncbi:MAG: alpha/beta fold hydrolase [Anaerolineae bacterium]|nr:alpha/beta fold hydrolase [Anaerolineae bacterium]